MTVVIRAGEASLADWRAIWRGAPVALDPSHRARRGGERRGGRADSGARRAGLRNQHRLRQTGGRAHRGGRSGAASAQHRALARGRRRRTRLGRDDAAHDGAEARQPRPGRFRRPAADAWPHRGDARPRADSGRPGARIGRRVGRSRAARAYGGGDDRRRRAHPSEAVSRPPPPRSPRPASSRSSFSPRKGWRCSTAPSSRPPMRSSACSRPKRCSAPLWRRARCRPTARADRMRHSTRASTRCRRHHGQIEVAAALRALLAGSAIRASHLTGDERVQDPYCLRCQPQVMGACLDLLRQAAATLDGGSQRGLRQSADLRRRRRSLVGRKFSRRAGRLRRRHHRARHLRDRLARRAADRASGRSGSLRAAGVPDAEARPQLRVHDPAGDRGGARRREQEPRLPGERRFDPDLRQSGGSRLDGGAWRAAPRADGGERLVDHRRSSSSPPPRPATFTRPSSPSAPLEALRARLRREVPRLDDDRFFHPDIAAATRLVRDGAVIDAVGETVLPGLERLAR